MTMRIEGPRSTQIAFSTGRVATVRSVPSFRAMKREGLLDDQQVFALQAVFDGARSAVDADIEDALLRHVFIDPPLCSLGLGVLDDVEVQEAVHFAITAFLATGALLEPDEEIADEDLPIGTDPFAAEEVDTLPESPTESAVDEDDLHAQAEATILASAVTPPSVAELE